MLHNHGTWRTSGLRAHMIHIHETHGLTASHIGQREQLYAARPVFRQRQIIFPSMSDCKNPSFLFIRLKTEQPNRRCTSTY